MFFVQTSTGKTKIDIIKEWKLKDNKLEHNINMNNIHQDLKEVCNDNILIQFLKDDNVTLNLTDYPLMRSYIFKRLNYLGSVLNMKINKKLLEKRMLF